MFVCLSGHRFDEFCQGYVVIASSDNELYDKICLF